MNTNIKYSTKDSDKIDLIKRLLDLDKRSIDTNDICKVAKTTTLSRRAAVRAWMNFVESGGTYDLRKTQNGNGEVIPVSRKSNATKKNNNITTFTAGTIIKEWMNTKKVNIDDFCVNHEISVNQYYEWLHELNVSGTLLGRMILKPTKYAKLNVKTMIWLKKYPNSARKSIKKLSDLELDAYRRAIQVLEKYL